MRKCVTQSTVHVYSNMSIFFTLNHLLYLNKLDSIKLIYIVNIK